MTEEEKFDELLSSKLSERDFPFDELNWDETERLIVQQERMEKIKRFALIFSGGLAAGILIMLPFIINTHNSLPDAISSKVTANQNTIAQNSVLPPINQPPATNANTNNTIAKEEKTPVQSAFVKKDTRTDMPGKSPNMPLANKTVEKRSSLLIADVKKPLNTLPATSNLIASANETNTPIVAPTKQESHSDENAPKASSQLPATTASTESINPSNTTTDNHTPTADNTTSINTQPIIGANPIKNLSVNNAAPKNKKDTTTTANSPPPILPPLNPDNPASSGPPSTNILSVYAGGTYSFGWTDAGIVTSTKEGNGITPWGGFNFTHYFAGDFSASLGIGYSQLSGLHNTYTSSVVQYDFGVNASSTSVTPQTVYYLAFPFKLQWNLDTKNMFGLGINYLLMLTTSSTLTNYSQSYSIENNTVSPTENPGTSAKQNGYTQGFNNSNMQLSISYTRMLTGRLGISPEFYYDFDNIENNSVSELSQNAKNMGLRLVLSYQFIK